MFFQFAAVPKMYINSKQMLPMLGKPPQTRPDNTLEIQPTAALLLHLFVSFNLLRL